MARYLARQDVTSNDVVYPSGAAQAGSVAVPEERRSSIVHVHVRAAELKDGSVFGQAAINIFGYQPDLNRWFAIAPINDGQPVFFNLFTGASKSPEIAENVPPTSGNVEYTLVDYIESIGHVAAFSRLYPMITGISSSSPRIAVAFLFAGP